MHAEDGGYVGYIREGFASLQNAISMTYIQLITQKPKESFPKIYLSRTPIAATKKDYLLQNVKLTLSIIILLGFSFSTTALLMVSVIYMLKLIIGNFVVM